MEFRIDEVKRQLIVENDEIGKIMVVNEFQELERKFLGNTSDVYKCELVLLDVEVTDDLGNKTGAEITKAFARRKDNHGWIMEFVPSEYKL